jgi:hypothetical protein
MKKPKSKIPEAIHESAADLFEAGVMNRATMRKFVGVASLEEIRLCLKPIQLQAMSGERTPRAGNDRLNM